MAKLTIEGDVGQLKRIAQRNRLTASKHGLKVSLEEDRPKPKAKPSAKKQGGATGSKKSTK